MILFLNEDRAYLSWVTHHRNGFVLDGHRKPTKHPLIVHRATCPKIKHSTTKTTHWTTGQHMKVCSLSADELQAWAKEQVGADPSSCVSCLATDESRPADQPIHLTKLDQEILSFILEVVMLHLDEGSGAYWLNVGMVATCLQKSPAQLSAPLSRLVDDGLLTVTEQSKSGEPLPAKCGLLPTVLAMKTLPAYQNRSDGEIEAEIRTLAGEKA